MKPNEDPTTSEILHRLVVPIQTRGNLGKSTEAIARCEWMSQRGVLWKGYDLDAFNRTLSTTYPEDVVFVEPGPEPEGELIKIFRCLAQQRGDRDRSERPHEQNHSAGHGDGPLDAIVRSHRRARHSSYLSGG